MTVVIISDQKCWKWQRVCYMAGIYSCRYKEHPLSFQWYSGFMSRWPKLKVLKPMGLELQRAKARTTDCVTSYNNEPNHILTKYDYITNLKGLTTSHKSQAVVAAALTKLAAVTSNPRILVTVLGCGNALVYQVPPYFVFPGTRIRPDLLEGKTPGADGVLVTRCRE